MLQLHPYSSVVDLVGFYVIIKHQFAQEGHNYEKKFKNAYKYYWQAPTRFPTENGQEIRPKSFSAAPSTRQKKTQYLMLQRVAISLIYIYQKYLRILLPSSCCFYPSCSEYTKQAIFKYGFLKGLLKGAKRLAHCHPMLHKATYDPLL
jgi:putative membrane protein insertion efficiency factor